MSTMGRRVRKPRGDYVFAGVAIVVTVLWVVLGLFPTFWMTLSAFKSSYESTLFPPSFLPLMPQRVTVLLSYDGAGVPADDASLLGLARDDALAAQWALFDANPREPIGEVQVQAYVDGKLYHQSSLLSWSYQYGRNRVWAATILDREQIIMHKAEVQDGDSASPFYEKGRQLYPRGTGPAMPAGGFPDRKIVTECKATLDALGVAGVIHGVTVASAPGRLFDSFVTGWNNAKKATGTLKWGRYFINSAVITAGGILTQWLFTAFAAFALSRLMSRRVSKYVTMFYLATMMIPPVATVIPLFLQMQSWHLNNTFWAIILPAIPSGFLIYIFKGFYNALPGDLFEAARVDGASEYWVFARVVVPLSQSVFAVVTLMCFLGGWNGGGGLMWSSLVLKDETMWPFPLALYYIASSIPGARVGANQNQLMAMALISAIPTLILFVFFQDRVAKGLVWSGLKG